MPPTVKATDAYKSLFFGIKRKRLGASARKAKASFELSSLPSETVTLQNNKTSILNKPFDSCVAKEEKEANGPGILNYKVKARFKKIKITAKERNGWDKDDKVTLLRKENRIFTWGSDIPKPIRDFSDIADLPNEIIENLREFEIVKPTAIQMQAIPVMLKKRELLVSAPTGSGKTLAFALPIILEILHLKRSCNSQSQSSLVAIILEPTRELAKQVYVQFLKFVQSISVTCGLLDSKNFSENVDVLVSTPYRLTCVLAEKSPELLNKLRWLIVDESDRLFDTTEGTQRCFRNQLSKIYQACTCSKFLHHAFFSATYSYEVEEWCKENLDNLAVICVGARNSAVHLVKQELVFAGSEQGKVLGLRSLFHQGFQPPAVVFVQSKDRARQLFNEIETFHPQVPAALFSSDLNDEERETAVTRFREGKVWVLICTDLMSRGLDLRSVNLIINFDLPTSIISYIHRIGRAGRAGRSGRAVTYFTEADLAIIRPIATLIKQAGFQVPEYTLRMQKLRREARKELLKRPPKRKRINVGGKKEKEKN